MATVYLGLGSNLGNREENLHSSIQILESRAGIILALSGLYGTPPWGFVSDNYFLNAVVSIKTSLAPADLLYTVKQIEQEMGRPPKIRNSYQDRIIDIDILLYNNLIIDTPDLVIPHPLIHERKFVLFPLAEIAPTLSHPVLRKTFSELSLMFS